MNVIAFIFALGGAYANFCQPIENLEHSLYSALMMFVEFFKTSGFSSLNVPEIVGLIIFAVLCLIPLAAAIQGICALLGVGRHIKRNLFICALLTGLLAGGVYYLQVADISSNEFLKSPYIEKLIPLAQRIDCAIPAAWAVCYLLASIFARNAAPKTQTQSQNARTPVNSANTFTQANASPVSLTKGQRVDLTKNRPGLSKLLIGLGWSVNTGYGDDFDLDASAFLLGSNGKVLNDGDFIFYNNLEHASGSVRSMGDDRKGGSGGDDEQIRIDLARVPDNIQRIAFTVTIHEAEERGQDFGRISEAYIRVVDDLNNREIMRYDLANEFSNATAVVVAEIYRSSDGWKFNAIGGGFNGGLKALCKQYGVNV